MSCSRAHSHIEDTVANNASACRSQIPVWQYALLALADVEGNFLVVCAYQYTSISSAMLLDCFTIPVVMLLSALFLSAKVRVSCCHSADALILRALSISLTHCHCYV